MALGSIKMIVCPPLGCGGDGYVAMLMMMVMMLMLDIDFEWNGMAGND